MNLKNLTLDESIEQHRKIWNWIADYGGCMHKHNYFVDCLQTTRPINDCFLCEFNKNNRGIFCNENCILDWGCKSCTRKNSLYTKYNEAKSQLNKELASKYAREIAELPVNETARFKYEEFANIRDWEPGKLNLSLEKAVELHYEMWNWIARHGLKSPGSALQGYLYSCVIDPSYRPYNDCYLCDYCGTTKYKGDYGRRTVACNRCPIESWGPNGQKYCYDENSYYKQFKKEVRFLEDNCLDTNFHSRSIDNNPYYVAVNLAYKIATLPIKKGLMGDSPKQDE